MRAGEGDQKERERRGKEETGTAQVCHECATPPPPPSRDREAQRCAA